jgi:hypothetical protein
LPAHGGYHNIAKVVFSWTLTTSSRLIAAPQFGLTRWAVKDCSRIWHFGNIIEPCISPSPEQGWCEKGHAQTKR